MRKLSLERAEEATRGTLEIKQRYDERLRRLTKQDIDTLPGELIADLAALAGSLNEQAVDRLFSVVHDVLSDIDSASRLRESLGTLTADSIRSDLESFSMGDYELATADKLSVLSSFASGRSLGALGGATIGALLAPPVGIAVGFGIGGLFAFHAFRSRTEQTFSTSFQRWMAAQIAQTQTTINTTFARRMIDLQGELRTAIYEAIGRRESEISESLNAAKTLLQAEEAKRLEGEHALKQRLELMQALQQQGAASARAHQRAAVQFGRLVRHGGRNADRWARQMNEWSLGIDFGTSYTVAAVATGTSVSGVDVESNGRDRIPSSVFLTEEGEILVGTAAQHQAVFAPSRYEPTPKRLIGDGDVFLEDRLVPVAELAAAVLRRVYTEACRQQGERAPTSIRLTHPAGWTETRVAVLRDAAERAGLPAATMVPEPVAAALRIAFQVTDPGRQIAVYDFGGGTFDAAVLRRTDRAFEVSGPPAGRDPLGGEDVDDLIIDYVGDFVGEEQRDGWTQLRSPTDIRWRRAAAGLRAEVQRAKETLSEVAACQLWIPGLEREVQLTRAELEKLIAADVEATVDTLELALRDADVAPDQLAGLYLVGGSSRIPLVAATIWRRLGVRPAVQDNPKAVVAMGAAGWIAGSTRTRASAPQSASETSAGKPSSTAFHSRLAMALESEHWPAGCRCVAALELDDMALPPTTVRARDEPAAGLDTADLAQRAGATRAARIPDYRELWVGPTSVLGVEDGLERRFTMTVNGSTVSMFEQYVVHDGRAFVLASPEPARASAAAIHLAVERPRSRDWFEPRFVIDSVSEWVVREQTNLQRAGTPLAVTTTRTVFGSVGQSDTWREREWAAVMSLPAAELVTHSSATVLNELPGELVTVRWRRDATPMLTKLGLATADGQGFSMKIDLPHDQQSAFSSLARHARLLGASGIAASS